MKVRSCFKDYYDPFFSGQGETYWRINEGPSKLEQFKLLEKLGFNTPEYGTVRELQDKGCSAIVVYTDEYAHTTMGKELLDGTHIEEKYLDMLGSEFIGNPHTRPSVSYRELHVGFYTFFMKCTGNDSWMSNYGDGEWEVLEKIKDITNYPFQIDYPLYAIDFVAKDYKMYAIDFNTCPGIGGTGVDKLLLGSEVVKEIENWYASTQSSRKAE